MSYAWAILWAQWRTLRNFYPRSKGATWTIAVSLVWYGMWSLSAIALARLMSTPAEIPLINRILPGGLLLLFLYWQVVPLLMAATGASLELRKLQVYPIPPAQLFSIEVMLRVTAAVEMFLVGIGIGVGALLNPGLPRRGAWGVALFVLFNLFLAVGLRDLLSRVLARKRIRELAFLLLVMCGALPQMLMIRGGAGRRVRFLLNSDAWNGWPWAATANLISGRAFLTSSAILLGWTIAAGLFGRWQFALTMSFDAQAAGAGGARRTMRQGLMESVYRLPSFVLRDPLAGLVEKEIRSLMRSPRFRLVFMMGFTFGLVVWLPLAFGGNGPTNPLIGNNYLTVVSVYSLLLLSEVCFWNSFGFDRSAAQIYFLAPVPFALVMIGKNLSALFFIALEILAVTTVCGLFGMPLSFSRLAEACAVTGVISIFLLSAGNLLSIHQARAVNPAQSFRSSAAGRAQAMLFVVYPLAFIPVGLAFLARYAFGTQEAFYLVLAIDAIIGLIAYQVALDSAVKAADRLKETMLAALSVGDGPIAG